MAVTLRLGLLAAMVVAVSAGCSQTEDAPVFVSPTGEAAATSSAPAGSGPDEITAACPLLPTSEVLRVMGGNDRTKLAATEGSPETGPDGSRFTCTYGRGEGQALVLVIGEQAGAPAEAVDAVVQESGASAKAVAGLGEAAVTYTVQGFRYVVAAVSHDSGHRLVFLGAPSIVPQEKLTELASGVVQRV